MQVDEDYNPTGELSDRSAKKQYLVKLRLREAEELRIKYLGAKLALAKKGDDSLNHHGSRKTIKAQSKQNQAEGRVTYVFQELDNANDKNSSKGDKDEDGDSLSDILQQKERIRSLITPDEDKSGDKNSLGGKIGQLGNKDGRSPYQGAQLNVVSINHKKNGANPVFDPQSNGEVPDKPVQEKKEGENSSGPSPAPQIPKDHSNF